VLGTFAIYSRKPRSPTPQERKLLEQFAHVASVAIEHTRAQESLRRSEAEYRDLIDVSPDAIYIINTDLTYVLANPAGAELVSGVHTGGTDWHADCRDLRAGRTSLVACADGDDEDRALSAF
jgi:PAS domain-containing protein